MRTLLQHAAMGFAMGAGSFVLAAMPSHGSDAHVREPLAAPLPSASIAPPPPPVVDVTAPRKEAPVLRKLRSERGASDGPQGRASRGYDDGDARDTDDFDRDPRDVPEGGTSACMTRDRPRNTAYSRSTAPRSNDTAAFFGGLRMPSLPVRRDPRVLKLVRYFTETPEGRNTFATSLRRSGRYEEVVEAALRDRNLPSSLLAVVFVESACFPTAVSSAGATGLWQLMPATARAYGLVVESAFDERRSIWRSTNAAAQHLADLYDRFQSWDLALAAYNVGYKSLVDRIEARGTDDFWELAAIEGALPGETMQYVPRVLATAVVLANLEEFGFVDVEMDPPLDAAELEVPSGMRVASIARAAHTSARRLRELNPEVIGESVPSRPEPTVLHVPSRNVSRARAAIARFTDDFAADSRDRAPFDSDLRGASHACASDDVAEDRGARRGRGRFPIAARDARDDRDDREDRDEDEIEEAPRKRFKKSSGPKPVVYFRASAGDTAASIARTFGLTEEQVLAQNGLDAERPIRDGALLQLRVAPAFTRQPVRQGPDRIAGDDSLSP